MGEMPKPWPVNAQATTRPGTSSTGAQHWHAVDADVLEAGPGAHNLCVGELGDVTQDAATDGGSRDGGGAVVAVVLVHRLEAGVAAKDEGAMTCLVAVEVGVSGAEHLLEHGWLHLGDQRLDEHVGHGDVDAHGVQDLAGGIARGNHHGARLEGPLGRHDLAKLALDLAELEHGAAGVEAYAQAACCGVVGVGRLERVCVAVSGAPGRADDLLGEVRVDGADLVAVDHAHVEAKGNGLVAQPAQDLEVALGLAQAEVSALAVLHVSAKLLGERGPEVLHGVHRKRELARVSAGLAHAAAVPGGAAVANDLVRLEDGDRDALLGEVVGRGAADDAGTDNNDVRGLIAHLAQPPSRTRSSRWDAWVRGSSRAPARRARRPARGQRCP